MVRTLVSVDKRKKLAVYEQDGVEKVVSVELDSEDKPILDSKITVELQRLFRKPEENQQILESPFTKAASITKIKIK